MVRRLPIFLLKESGANTFSMSLTQKRPPFTDHIKAIYNPKIKPSIYLSLPSHMYISLSTHSLQSFRSLQLQQNLHSIHRLDPFLYGILSVRHVCQRRQIETHRFDKIR